MFSPVDDVPSGDPFNVHVQKSDTAVVKTGQVCLCSTTSVPGLATTIKGHAAK